MPWRYLRLCVIHFPKRQNVCYHTGMRRLALALSLGIPTGALAIIPDYGPDTFFTGVGTLSGASCVAIAPNWVITARHVGGTTVNFDGLIRTADQRFDHEEADIALLRFNTPLNVASYAIDFDNPMGRQATLVGYGSTGTAGATGYTITGGGGIRRKATNMIDRLQIGVTFDNIDFFDAYEYDLDGPQGNGTLGGAATATEGGLWFGDSGGGWLVNNGGTWNLVATNSYIDDGNSNNAYNDYGDLGGGVALRNYQGWIQSTMVPEPATFAVVGLGVALLAKRRRR